MIVFFFLLSLSNSNQENIYQNPAGLSTNKHFIISKSFYLLLKNRLCCRWRASYLFLHYVLKESGKQMKRKRKRNEHEGAKREINLKRENAIDVR